jgi:hypothetical protein
MKIEPRGKYPGVKVHLDEEECQELLKGAADNPGGSKKGNGGFMDHEVRILAGFAVKLARKIRQLQIEMPELLDERTEEQIRKELEIERDKSAKKLAAMDKGKDWKKVE